MKPIKHVWVLDDDPALRFILQRALATDHIQVTVFEHGQMLLSAIEKAIPDLLLTDIRIPRISGIEILKQLKEKIPTLKIIVMTAYADIETATTAFREGAFDYCAKPFDLDELTVLVYKALESSSEEVEQHLPNVSSMLGSSPAMQTLFRAIGRLSQSDATVLIQGETGTGKELVARALHAYSRRSAQAFIAINTAAIPKELLESELFGHEKGAFTGAQSTHRGRFEQAQHGTLFLDEIGDMPAELQTRFLRVLSDKGFYRVGGQQLIQAQTRIIAATHQDLPTLVKQGLFREDLWHRLNVVNLRVPPLRERVSDIPILAREFLHQSAKALNMPAKLLSEAACTCLQKHAFHGNVRQLENLCHWLTVMIPHQHIRPDDLPPEFQNPENIEQAKDGQTWQQLLQCEIKQALTTRQPNVYENVIDTVERLLIDEALQLSQGQKAQAAQLLQIGRNTLARKLGSEAAKV